MSLLNEEQRNRAIEVMREYLSAPKNPDGETPFQRQSWRDEERARLIEKELKPLLKSYLANTTGLEDFKSTVDGINKRHAHWGFKGIKGQMFFNMIVNVAPNSAECDQELKAALECPSNEDMARSRIRTFSSYVKRIGEDHVQSGGTNYQKPKVSSVPFFLSYFWQIHDRFVWPVYYTNSVKAMYDMNLWQEGENLADSYIDFKNIHEELAELFNKASKQKFDLYGVEHVFWFKRGNPYGDSTPLKEDSPEELIDTARPEGLVGGILPDSYVPPIIAILPRIARHDPELESAAKASGTSLERAFEKGIDAAFTMLGYETALLGQGQGRVPDGRAVDADNRYAILWDAKVRADGYRMGSDDRTIREYVSTQSRELKRRLSLRNMYYAIVSSAFTDDADDTIRMLKMETDINEVCLIEADALVGIVDAKLRDPRAITLGPDGIQRLFSSSGVLSSETVRELLS